jgi:nucleotide-binding universal stress UspA family protein
MYRKILVAYNGTQESLAALKECIRLAPDPLTEIHLLSVIDAPSPRIVGDYGRPTRFDADASMAEETKKWDSELSRRAALLREAGLNTVIHLETGEPVAIIEEFVNRLDIELLIVGHSRHRSWATRWWRGSTDASLIERISCTILIAPEPHTDAH